MAMIGVSPAPAEGMSLRSSKIASIWHILKPRHPITGKMRIRNAPLLKLNGLKKRAAESLNHRPNHLVAQSVRIHDRAALEHFHQFFHGHGIFLSVHKNFREGGDIAALLVSRSHSESLPLFGFLPRPAKRLRPCFKHSAHSRVGQILQTKFEWIHGSRVRQRIHVRLSREMVRGCRQPSIRTAAQHQWNLWYSVTWFATTYGVSIPDMPE